MVTSSKSNWIVGVAAHAEPVYDGHTLEAMLKQMQQTTGHQAKEAFCDRSYRGHGYTGLTKIYLVGRHRVGRRLRRWFCRRAAIEPVIGHMKQDNRLSRNYLKGSEGDRTNAVLSACGFNLRKLLRGLVLLWFGLVELVASQRASVVAKPQRVGLGLCGPA